MSLLGFSGSPFAAVGSEFGFEVPQGDPGELNGAARQAGLVANGWDSDAGTLRGAAGAASAAWTGAAQSAFGSYAAVLVAAFDRNSGVLSDVSGVLSGLASELESAQRATRQAYDQCTHYQGVVQSQTQAQQQYAQNANQLSMSASLAPHPHARADLQSRADGQQRLADQAAGQVKQASGELDYWKQQGANACSAYQQHAEAASRRIVSLQGQLQHPRHLHADAPIPIPVSAADVKFIESKLPAIAKIPASDWGRDAGAALRRLTGGRPLTPAEALLLSQVIAAAQTRAKHQHSGGGSIFDDVWSGLKDGWHDVEGGANWFYENVIKPGADGVASLAGALVHDPKDTLNVLEGALLTAAGAGGEFGGGLLDATGIGAPVGVSLNVASAGAIAAGGTLATKGAIGLGSYAAQHPVQVLNQASSAPSETAQQIQKVYDTSDVDGILEHTTDRDLQAAQRELNGETVATKSDGTPYDHVQEVRDAQNGLMNRIDTLKKMIGSGKLTPGASEVAQQRLGYLSKLLDRTEKYVPRSSR